MSNLPGVYTAYKKNNEKYYRASLTFQNKHISLGSYSDEKTAHNAYCEAHELINTANNFTHFDYSSSSSLSVLSFEKRISLLNFKVNKVYIKNPIFMHKRYFSYFISQDIELLFDVDDLFYYSNHKIFKRGGYLFVNDYGMQVNILSRYGIKNHSVKDIDYRFVDGDSYNFRHDNIEIINPYYGVRKELIATQTAYVAKININGTYTIGKYDTIEKAAIAYNKIADFLNTHHLSNKTYERNYITTINSITYSELYNKIRIPNKIKNLLDD